MPTLHWIGKEAVVNHHRHVPYRLLHCDKTRSAGDPDSGNLLVQGDNLEALKALLPYYAGKVKCIYIDPPYNTGNESWIYNDNVNSPQIKKWLGQVVGKEAEDLTRHDKWLCMMYPRLALLREFLSEDGAIFVSIDDAEVSRLALLLEEIFGPQNFVVNMIWQKMDSPSSNFGVRSFTNYHDHTLVFAKRIDSVRLNQLSKPEILNAYPEAREDGSRYRLRQLRKNGKSARREDRPTMYYPITAPDGTELYPKHPTEGWEGRWAVGKTEYDRRYLANEIEWREREYGWMAYTIENAPPSPVVPNPSILTDAGQNRQAKQTLNEILGLAHGFDTPKPVELLTRITQIAGHSTSLILDSFAGSGTTGHAVLQMNKVDGGSRRFICIEMDETIARDVTSQRLRKVVEGYINAKGEAVEPLGGGFRFCTLGKPLFDEYGSIDPDVKYADLAAHVFFSETGSPLPKKSNGQSPLLGVFDGRAVYLLFNGILGDKKPNGGNVLTGAVLESLPKHDGPKVIYGEACRLGESRLRAEGVTFKQVPWEVRVG